MILAARMYVVDIHLVKRAHIQRSANGPRRLEPRSQIVIFCTTHDFVDVVASERDKRLRAVSKHGVDRSRWERIARLNENVDQVRLMPDQRLISWKLL